MLRWEIRGMPTQLEICRRVKSKLYTKRAMFVSNTNVPMITKGFAEQQTSWVLTEVVFGMSLCASGSYYLLLTRYPRPKSRKTNLKEWRPQLSGDNKTSQNNEKEFQRKDIANVRIGVLKLKTVSELQFHVLVLVLRGKNLNLFETGATQECPKVFARAS
jgi:hypothetical protein